MAESDNKWFSAQFYYVLFFIAVVAFCGLAYTKLSYRIESVDQGYRGEALTNPYLAADYYLRRMGQPVKKIKSFSETQTLLKTNDTLFIPGIRISYDTRRSEQLLNWVDQGGHLIITSGPGYNTDSANPDRILNKLGMFIERKVPEDDQQENNEPVNLDIADEEDFWQVDFEDLLIISFAENFKQQLIWLVSEKDRVHAVQIKSGDGRITLLSDTRIFRNHYINLYDHAAFLFTLTNDQLNSGVPGIFYYSILEGDLSLIQWLWANAWPLFISSILFFCIILWMLIPRFGPVINIHQPIQRRFLDHLVASGNYHWRHGHYFYLLTSVRKQLSKQIKLKYPELAMLSRSDQLVHFAEMSCIDIKVIEDALFESSVEHENDFVIKIKILEKLRKSL